VEIKFVDKEKITTKNFPIVLVGVVAFSHHSGEGKPNKKYLRLD
jgi:hypothetical protein